MTARMTPPRKPSHWFRNAWIGVVVVMVLLAALGSAASRQASSAGPGTPANPASSDTESPADTGSPAPAATTLLSIKGTGYMTSEPFQASGDSVDVAYDYTCTGEGSFALNFYGTNVSPLLPDALVGEFGSNGSSTLTETLNGATGPFHVEVDSVCAWSVEVIGTP